MSVWTSSTPCWSAPRSTPEHHSAIHTFVGSNQDELHTRATGLFPLSLSSALDDPERRAEAADYVDDLLEESGWQPDSIGLFGGALRYSKYGFLRRLLLKRIAKDATGDVDPSRDYEYTDWAEVEGFARDFGVFVEGRLGEGHSFREYPDDSPRPGGSI